MRAHTSAASAICGTQRGDTNAVTSMRDRPEADSASMKATFVSVVTTSASFCRPSRGPTSTTVTEEGSGGITRSR